MAVYDSDTDPSADELEKLYNQPSATDSGSQRLAASQQTGRQNAMRGNAGPARVNNRSARYGNSGPAQTNSRSGRHSNMGTGQKAAASPASARELKNNEQAAGMHYSGSKDSSPNQVGKGFTGSGKNAGNTRRQAFLEKLKGSSTLKKRLLIAGAVSGGATAITVLIFLVMLPFKIENIVNNLEEHFSAAASSAIENEVENDVSTYIKKSVIPSMNRGGCKSTIDPSCVVFPEGSGYFGKLYAAWSDGRMMNKLANLPGGQAIIISKNRGTFYMNINGENMDLTKLLKGDQSIFDLPGTKRTSRSEIRATVKSALKQGTLWDKTYNRFMLGKYLEQRFGIKRCIMFCDTRDKFTDSIETKKLAGKLWLIQRVQGPYAQSYGLLIQCILAPDQCDTKIRPGTDGRETTELNSKLEAQLSEYIAENGVTKLADLAQKAGDINKLGVSGYMVKLLAEQLAEKLGGDASKVAAGEAVDKAVPIAGQIDLAVQIIKEEEDLPKIVKDVSYASRAEAAAQEAEMFATLESEIHAGHADMAEVGSAVDLLGSGLKDANGFGSDVTDAPLYGDIMGAPTPTLVNASIFSDLLGGNAFADSASPATTDHTYRCNDGKPVPSDKKVCPEEDFSDPGPYVQTLNFFLDNAETASAFGFHLPSYVPGAQEYNDFVAPIRNAVFQLDTWFGDIAGLVSDAAVTSCTITPPCNAVLNTVSGSFAQFAGWAIQQITPQLLTSLSGARNFDLIAAGFDVQNNAYCQDELGCKMGTPQEVAKIQNEQIAEQKQEFESQPMFARMFNLNDSYSLASRLAMAMPTNMLTATNDGVSSILTNPFSKLGSMLSSIFSSNRAFAAEPPQNDMFGITQYVPDMSGVGDRETFWNNNCVNGPIATFDADTNTLTELSSWTDAHTTQNPDTMQPETTAPDPCKTIQAGIEAAGALFSVGVLQSGLANNTPTEQADTNSVYQIGDDLTTGMRDSGNLTQKYTDKGLNASQIDTQSNLTIADAQSKITADQANIKSADAIVIQLGAADHDGALPADQQAIDSLIHTIRTINANASIYWVNTRSSKIDMSTINLAIANESTTDGYTVINWANEAADSPSKYTFASDGTLLATPTSYSNLASFMIGEMAEAGS